MAKKQHNELVAGLFVVVTLIIGILVVLWLGAGLWLKPHGRAFFYVKESSGSMGLKVGSLTQITDEVVGKIQDIRPDPTHQRTLYVVELTREGLTIHADGNAIVASGLVGDRQLIITSRGSDAAPPTDESNPVEIRGGLEQTMNTIANVADNLREISRTILKELSAREPDSLLGKIHALSDNLKAASAHIMQMAGQLAPEFDRDDPNSMLARLKQTATSLADATATIDQYAKTDVAEILAQLRQFNSEILKVSKDFSTISETARQVVVLNRDNLNQIIENLVQVSAELKATSADVRRSPWKMFYKPKPGEMRSQDIQDAARAFADGASQLNQTIARLKALPPDIRSDDPELTRIRDEIKESFDKFSTAEQALWKELAK
ncbi:MAG: hypothetical protein WC869_03535 [Phycisphaerae bacterium]|jgi:ABC-type transporter Mla subunit MlaD